MPDKNLTADKVLSRGVEQILPSKKGLANLMNKKNITIYQGFDPTADSLHIGHLIGIRKLAQFQKLGHKVIFLIGDFTGMIGDPSDKSAARVKLSKQEVLKNSRDYVNQVKNILDFEGKNKAEVKYNSKWLSKLNFEDILELSSNFTVQQLIERDFFQKRIKNEKPIYLHEFLYPLMQGYDSVVMNVDLEVGGNDQLFNMLAGRSLMKSLKNKDKFVLAMKLLTDEHGDKMGKSEGNAVALSDSPNDIFSKIMSYPDSFLPSAIEILTDFPIDITKKEKPMNLKKKIAFDVVRQLKGKKKAEGAQLFFEKTFQEKKTPNEVKTIKTDKTKYDLLDLVDLTHLVPSRSQAKRLISQGAVYINGEKAKDLKAEIKINDEINVKIGKARFAKIVKK